MASIDSILVGLRTVADRLNAARQALDVAVDQTRDVHEAMLALGALGVAERMTAVLDRLGEGAEVLAQAQAAADEAIELTLIAQGGAYSGGIGDHSGVDRPAAAGHAAPRAGQGDGPGHVGGAGRGRSADPLLLGQQRGADDATTRAVAAAPDRRGPGRTASSRCTTSAGRFMAAPRTTLGAGCWNSLER